jgi:regulator of protease activity HflC (stomatin/prohibitin superfamily)
VNGYKGTRKAANPAEIVIKDTHRGLLYKDGVLDKVIAAGRYEYPKPRLVVDLFRHVPEVEVVLVDMRERDMTIKGQEILTSDKVAIRVSIVVRYRVIEPVAAIHAVQNYEERIYTDVQLAARRSLAAMALETILTNRNQLSDDILSEVKESAASYGVEIGRADVKDLIFPGNLEQIMNRVITAERMAEEQMINARARAEVQRLDALTNAETQRIRAEAQAIESRTVAEALSQAEQIKALGEVNSLRERAQAAEAYSQHPALLRLMELDTLQALARNASARLYINFDSEPRLEVED